MNAAELIKYMGLWMRWDSIPAVSRETAQKFDELWSLTKQLSTIPGTYNKQLWLWTERGQMELGNARNEYKADILMISRFRQERKSTPQSSKLRCHFYMRGGIGKVILVRISPPA